MYCLAWCCNLVTTSFLLFLSANLLFPSFRHFCFDPPGDALTATASLEDSISATEEKATQWAESILDLFMSVASPSGGSKGATDVGEMVSEEVNGVMVNDMHRQGVGEKGESDKGDTKQQAIQLYGKPAMRIIGGVADKWERVGK